MGIYCKVMSDLDIRKFEVTGLGNQHMNFEEVSRKVSCKSNDATNSIVTDPEIESNPIIEE